MKSYVLLAPKNRFTHLILLEMQALFGTVLLCDDPEKLPKEGLLVYDADSFSPPIGDFQPLIGYTKDPLLSVERALLLRPFRLEALRAMLLGTAEEKERFFASSFAPATAPLTKTEEALLSLLLEANGQIVSKSALASALFPDAEDGVGSVAVYVYYLRKKLESDGKKRILSHRGKGYSISLR